MWVFTKTIETNKFKAIAGMPVPPKYSSVYALNSIRTKYGKDSVKQVDYSNPATFAGLVSEDGKSMIENLRRLKALSEDQAREIKQLRTENANLTVELKKSLAKSGSGKVD